MIIIVKQNEQLQNKTNEIPSTTTTTILHTYAADEDNNNMYHGVTFTNEY
jgi:hypothetical protein